MVLRPPHHALLRRPGPGISGRQGWNAEGSRPTADLTRRQSNSGSRFQSKHGRTRLPSRRGSSSTGQKRRQQGELHACDSALSYMHMQALTGTHTFAADLSVNKLLRRSCRPQLPDLRRPCEPSVAARGRTVLASQAGAPKGAQWPVSQGTQPRGRATGHQRRVLGEERTADTRHQGAEGTGRAWTQALPSLPQAPAPATLSEIGRAHV